MRTTFLLRILSSWLVAFALTSGLFSPAWAQTKQSKPSSTANLAGTGQLTMVGPFQVCPNTVTTFSARGECSFWYWEVDGGNVLTQQDIEGNSSSITISWATPGTYTITVYTDCSGTNSVSRTITVLNTTPGNITTSGTTSQATATSATICQGNSLQLVPPANSTNWSWDGANITSITNGIATVQPVAEKSTYTLTYSPSGSSCPITTTFTVNVAAPPSAVEVLNNEPYGKNWNYGSGTFTFSVKNPDPTYVYNWYESETSTTALATGPNWTITVTQSKTYYVSATACREGSRTAVPVLLRKVQLQANGVVPTAPVRLVPGTPLVLQATSSVSGPLTWFLNGLEVVNPSSSCQNCLTVTQSGRYTARTQYPADVSVENESQTVEIVNTLDNQTANTQLLTYTRETQVLKPGVTTPEQVAQLTTVDRTQSITYLTGWGQPLQQVAVQAGPTQQDVIQHFTYAGAASSSQTYLPFAVSSQVKAAGLYETDPLAKLTAYYAAVDAQPYATTTTEASPLNRPTQQAAAGTIWAAHTNRISYVTNSVQDGVRRWSGLDGSGQYAAGQLSKEVLLDADERRTELYKDSFGRVVLQRKVTGYGSPNAQTFDTYSIYAAAGYLQYTIPPEAVRTMAAAGTWNVNNMPTGFADQWLYQYTYDNRGRLVERKFPGAAPVYLVYDKADRPILIQDGTHRAVNQWLFTKYDAQSRPVVSGLYYYNSPSATLRLDVQKQADNASPVAEFESRENSGYTTTNTFPVVQDGVNGAVVLSMTFFDDYKLTQGTTPDYSYQNQGFGSSEPQATDQVRGMQTLTKTRVVQAGGQYGGWLTAALFYDQYGNLIQRQSNNLLQTGSALSNMTTLVYRQQGFVPQVIRSLKTQQTAGLAGNITPVVSVRNRYSYDATGRLLQTWQQHQWKNVWEPEVLVSSATYTGLGELTQKRLHSRDGLKFLQKEDFTYDLHGQLVSINKSNLASNEENDLFGMMLFRETAASNGNTPRYDGSITAVRWSVYNSDPLNQREQSYVYAYDGLGRLTAGTYAARINSGTSWSLNPGAYDEKITDYDANGNIRGLQRYSKASESGSPVLLDNLTFTYTGTGNQHSKVDDTGDITRGFKDARVAQEYVYDPNGSITRDENKGVNYTYNTLNKVEKQTVGSGTLTYTYSADGILLKRETAYSGATTKTEYYLDGLVYQAAPTYAGLVSIPTAEGRALVGKTTDARLTYEYHLRDHLGNLRVGFRAQSGNEDLKLTMEPGADEEGDYPRFRNVTSTRTTARYFQGTASASVTNFQPGPYNRIPVAHGDQIQVSVFYATPAGTQYGDGSSSGIQADNGSTATRMLAVAPTLLTVTSSTSEGQRKSKIIPGLQLSLTGVLSALTSKHVSQPQRVASTLATVQDAYIAWTFLNEQDQVISTGRQTVPVRDLQSWWRQTVTIPVDLSNVDSGNGYLRIQLLNDGSQPVFFDNITITKPKEQPLVTQENHYYPFGMSLSGVAVKTMPVSDLSKEQFNDGATLQDDLLGAEGGVYSTFFRTYDPTTGRFTGVDPLADVTANWTPYQFALSNPINANDPTGALTSFLDWNSFIRSALRGDVEEGYYTQGGGPGFSYISKEFSFNDITLGLKDGNLGYYSTSNTSVSRLYPNSLGMNLGDVGLTAKFTTFNHSITFDAGTVSYNWKNFETSFTNTPQKSLLDRTGDAVGSHGLFSGYFSSEIDKAARLAKSVGRNSSMRVPFISGGRLAMNSLVNIKPSTALMFSSVAKYATPVFVAYTAADMLNDNKLTAGDIYEGAVVAAQIYFPVFGLVYGAADLGTSLITGTSLTSRIKNGIDSQITTNIKFE